MVHELRELGGAEELADGGHNGLGVNQIVRHGRCDFLENAHLFFDRPFHSDEADAELVLEKFADRADAAVPEMVDVVHGTDALTQAEQILDGIDEVLVIQGPFVEAGGGCVVVELDVELHPADTGKIILPRVEEHAIEKLGGRVDGGRIARAQLAVDFEQRFVLQLHGIFLESAREDVANFVAFREEEFKTLDASLDKPTDRGGREFFIGFEDDFARRHINDVGEGVSTFKVIGGDFELLDFRLGEFAEHAVGNLLAGGDDRFASLGRNSVGKLHFLERVPASLTLLGDLPEQLVVLADNYLGGRVGVERTQDLFVRLQAHRAKEHSTVEFAFPVDTHVEKIFAVVFELDPGSSIGDDLPKEVALSLDAFEEDTGRAVQLGDDDAFSTVDDKGTIFGHQRDFSEEDFLFLNVAD